jgi:hypothetical protein
LFGAIQISGPFAVNARQLPWYWRGVPSSVPAAESAASWRLGELFDRRAAMMAPGGGGATLAAKGPERGS